MLHFHKIFHSSPEEVDSFREKMLVKTRMVIVGSSDDALRVKRSNRSMEGVYQSMVDNMITVKKN